ncbi:dCTP pyrophosphatase 1-like isoform X2 [Mizuhopecten yessoensis]|uniref:dCTP pyrophosphatase 1 n=2 Tax=Mizuhopecten yessoensis TaxID=6573 RepID=A0A210QJJ8_MIZYE|nr:dCTP pyrophosphatase 1-like isoform X2 [Mizuhopecten yessoensis]OWF48922.1 dCTP pyrophosphatase 1 [Mizuhopecten yessoensis]
MAEGDHSLSKKSKNEPEEETVQHHNQGFRFSEDPSLEKIRELQSIFARERNWEQFHTPRNILLALVGEVGELAEIFQWKGEVKEGLSDFTDKERIHVGHEMSDVLLYLVRLADRCHIDLPSVVLKKMEQNRQKYPADIVYGKSDKYTEYQ